MDTQNCALDPKPVVIKCLLRILLEFGNILFFLFSKIKSRSFTDTIIFLEYVHANCGHYGPHLALFELLKHRSVWSLNSVRLYGLF